MDEETYGPDSGDIIIKAFAIVCLWLITMVSGCLMHSTTQRTKAVTEMVKSGASPMEASCAAGFEHYGAVCAITVRAK